MARLNQEQAEQLRRERSHQILKAALSVFAESGLENTKMSMIAKAAGVSHGLLYHYFQSKEEVLNSSLRWAMEDSREIVSSLMQSNETPLDKVRQFLTIVLSIGNQDVFRIIQQSSRHPQLDDETRLLIQQTGEGYFELLVPIMMEGQAAGEIIREDPVQLTMLLLNLLAGIMADNLGVFQQNRDWNISMLLRMLETR